MNGGVIDIDGNLNIGEDGSTGDVQLDGGTIYANNLNMGADPYNPSDPCGTMDITGGVLVLDGDRETKVDGYYQDGWITVGVSGRPDKSASRARVRRPSRAHGHAVP